MFPVKKNERSHRKSPKKWKKQNQSSQELPNVLITFTQKRMLNYAKLGSLMTFDELGDQNLLWKFILRCRGVNNFWENMVKIVTRQENKYVYMSEAFKGVHWSTVDILVLYVYVYYICYNTRMFPISTN